jgi:hypothetical protein
VAEISRKAAAAKIEEAKAIRAKSDEEFAVAARRLEKARKMLVLAGRD